MNSNHRSVHNYSAIGFLVAASILVMGVIGGLGTFAYAATMPVISEITTTDVGTSTATIHWTTDATSSSWVLYGPTMSYGLATEFDMTATTSHEAHITGLTDNTLYHFVVSSGNEMGTSTSPNNTFTTMLASTTEATSTATTTPLAVTGIDVISSVATADNLFADGWKWVLHLTLPDTEDAFRMKFSDFVNTISTSTATIPVASNIRIFSPQSSNAMDQASALAATASNVYGGWMTLVGDTSTTTPGRQVDLTIEMRIPIGTAAGSYTTTFGAQSVPSAATSTTP